MKKVIGIDLGGTNIRGGIVMDNCLSGILQQRIAAHRPAEDVLQQIYEITDDLITDSVAAIGVGVPGLVDATSGTVFDVVNIPSWKEIPLQKLLEDRYQRPVIINNDANCFALGEYYFGQGQGSHSMIGLTIGTGLGSGIIVNGKLYAGNNCGAGEFGMIDYKEQVYEYYASGQYFQNVYNRDGEEVFKSAAEGDKEALTMYTEMGTHLGNAIKVILFALDVDLIILGGSVRKAFPYFSQAMWQSIKSFAFKRTAERLRVKVSELENSGILGAAALYYDQQKVPPR
ncbi:MAG TPA: ROK family protein [Flavisolibacter sp.]|nr:ROK family protein [Flavisolibacter sp.]